MNPIFSDLTQEERAAVIIIGCAIWSSPNNGRINLTDPEVISYVKAFLPTDANGNIDMNEFQEMYKKGYSMGSSHCYALLSHFDQRKKSSLRVLFSNLAWGNGVRTLSVSNIMKTCGFGEQIGWENNHPGQKNQKIEEVEGVKPITGVGSKPFVRICDVRYVREKLGKIQRIQTKGGNDILQLPVEFKAWREKGLCPANGLVGIICEKLETEEGTLCIVVFSNTTCIGILEGGLEYIDEEQYISKQANNSILSCDGNGERMKNLLGGKYENILADKKSAPSWNKTIRYYATKQDRFENGRMVCPTSYVQRLVLLEYTDMGREVTITVMGVMQPKHAKIVDDDGVVLKYVDTDNPGFTYEIETNPQTNEIERISIFVAYMGVEYRYTN